MPQNKEELYHAKVKAVQVVHEDIRVVTLGVDKAFVFEAGQYVYVRFNGMEARPYSIASRPGQEILEIHIKRGQSEISQYIMEELTADEDVELSVPQGSSTLSVIKEDKTPVLALAGGLGVAPLKAIIEQALYQNYPAPITLFWGTVTEDEQYLAHYFEYLAASHENFNFQLVTGGSVTEAALENQDDLSDKHIFISGAPAMISHAIPLLLDKKAERSKISYDQHPEAATLKPL